MIYEKAYAKVNLGLEVINKRDDGYHNLNMIMLSIDHYDELYFEIDNDIKLICDKYICDLRDNLIYKIANIIKNRYNVKSGAKISIKKNIKSGGGLGGGSSDAAATIRGLNRLWNLDLSVDEMIELGNLVGSDVAFCVEGKPSLVQGRGDIVNHLNLNLDLVFILVCPNYSMSTKEVFTRFSHENKSNNNINLLIKSLLGNNLQEISNNLFNELENVVYEIAVEKNYITNKELIKTLVECGCKGAVMSGSGSTVIGIVENERNANDIVIKLQKIYPHFNIFYCKNR